MTVSKCLRLSFAAPAALIMAACLILAWGQPRAAAAQDKPAFESHRGKFLVASPAMRDPRFARTVIYIVDHNAEGALGIVVNRRIGIHPLATLFDSIGMPRDGEKLAEPVAVHWGGPVATELVLMLHSVDFTAGANATRKIADGIALSDGIDGLKALTKAEWPRNLAVYAGYAGWRPGQIEDEIAAGQWSLVIGDLDLVFSADQAGKWDRAWAMRTQDL